MMSGYLLLRLEIVILKKGRPICCMNGTFLFIVYIGLGCSNCQEIP